ncbi:MAG: helix-turn-helix domain-containing protein [Planctomycetota bacterium]|nr:helix-turn-helix domain-containing protein [Planctomycetota bacterium]
MQNHDGQTADSVDRLLTVQEAAKILTISPRHLWDLTDRGELPAIKIGRSVRYAQADIDAFIAKSRTRGG